MSIQEHNNMDFLLWEGIGTPQTDEEEKEMVKSLVQKCRKLANNYEKLALVDQNQGFEDLARQRSAMADDLECYLSEREA
ncbi:MAG: hypothetical protein AB9888_15490 [Bacteroidales bacterium]